MYVSNMTRRKNLSNKEKHGIDFDEAQESGKMLIISKSRQKRG